MVVHESFVSLHLACGYLRAFAESLLTVNQLNLFCCDGHAFWGLVCYGRYSGPAIRTSLFTGCGGHLCGGVGVIIAVPVSRLANHSVGSRG
jgi:hypothetical protein